MITIADEPSFMNKVLNHPDVKPTACPGVEEEIDVSNITESEDHFFLEYKPYGGFCMCRNDYDSYIVHTSFLPSTPSDVVQKAVREAFIVAFIELDATEIWTSACSSNVPATRLCKFAGFKEMFSRPSRIAEGEKERFFRTTIDEFIIDNIALAQLGQQFHDLVGEDVDHPQDNSHDCYVGAAVAMVQCHNAAKAQRVYNRWAMLAGYELMSIDWDKQLILVGHMEIQLDKYLVNIEDIKCHRVQH